MNDRAVALLEQYEIEVLRTRKGRGAILCDTQQGCLIFKEYTGREEQLRLQEQVLKHLEACGNISAERLLATREGALSVTDRDGVRYILKTWWEENVTSVTGKNAWKPCSCWPDFTRIWNLFPRFPRWKGYPHRSSVDSFRVESMRSITKN